MCRNIKTLYNFDPPAGEKEIQDAALQFVRKVSGYRKPSLANEEVFLRGVAEVTSATMRLLNDLKTTAPKRNRELEVARARSRAAKRFGTEPLTT